MSETSLKSNQEIEAELRARGDDDLHKRLYVNEFIRARCLSQAPSKSAASRAYGIFSYWHEGFEAAPQIVQCCKASLISHSEKKRLVLVDDACIRRLVEIPEYIYQKTFDNKTHFSDILRFSLLSKFGGIWSDATCLHTINLYFGPWFLMSRRGSRISNMMKTAFEAYWQDHSTLVDYFRVNFIFEALYIQSRQFRVEWDQAAHLDAVAAHDLQFNLLRPFHYSEYSKLLKASPVHKLTYKIDCAEADAESVLHFMLSRPDELTWRGRISNFLNRIKGGRMNKRVSNTLVNRQ